MALAFLCAARAAERLSTLIFQPIYIQRQIFGRVVAYPWRLQNVEIYMTPEVYKYWTFKARSVPPPLPVCNPSDMDLPLPAGATRPDWQCRMMEVRNVYMAAEWEAGRLKISHFEDPPLQDDLGEVTND